MENQIIRKFILGVSVLSIISIFVYTKYIYVAPSNDSNITPTPTETITSTPSPSTTDSIPITTTQTPTAIQSKYKDGDYSDSEPTEWGKLTLIVSIKDGRINNINTTAIPDSPPSKEAIPILINEQLKAQDQSISGISGATDTSRMFSRAINTILQNARA